MDNDDDDDGGDGLKQFFWFGHAMIDILCVHL
jgi:hypothetical protein